MPWVLSRIALFGVWWLGDDFQLSNGHALSAPFLSPLWAAYVNRLNKMTWVY